MKTLTDEQLVQLFGPELIQDAVSLLRKTLGEQKTVTRVDIVTVLLAAFAGGFKCPKCGSLRNVHCTEISENDCPD